MSNKQCIVTGAAGFLGSHLAEKLLKKGFEVIGVDNFCTSSQSNFEYLQALPEAKNFTAIEADVSKDWNWAPKNKGRLAHVFHFACPASPPLYQKLMLETMAVNSTGLLNALEYTLGTPARVLFASTSEVYGDPEVSPQAESYRGCVNTVGPRSCYDESKRFGESLVWSFNKKHQTKHSLVRIFNTYGPRMSVHDGRVVINYLIQLLEKKPYTVYGDGKQTRSFCYVDDLIEGILRLSTSEHLGPINVGNPHEFTILELASEVHKLENTDEPKFEFLPLPADDPLQRKPDIALAKKHLNWEPKVALSEGLSRMLNWLRSQQR